MELSKEKQKAFDELQAYNEWLEFQKIFLKELKNYLQDNFSHSNVHIRTYNSDVEVSMFGENSNWLCNPKTLRFYTNQARIHVSDYYNSGDKFPERTHEYSDPNLLENCAKTVADYILHCCSAIHEKATTDYNELDEIMAKARNVRYARNDDL